MAAYNKKDPKTSAFHEAADDHDYVIAYDSYDDLENQLRQWFLQHPEKRIDSLHIFDHGNAGQAWIGNENLTLEPGTDMTKYLRYILSPPGKTPGKLVLNNCYVADVASYLPDGRPDPSTDGRRYVQKIADDIMAPTKAFTGETWPWQNPLTKKSAEFLGPDYFNNGSSFTAYPRDNAQ